MVRIILALLSGLAVGLALGLSAGSSAMLACTDSVENTKEEAFYEGKKVSGAAALDKAGLKPVKLGPKEGLSLINGTQQMTAVGGVLQGRAERLARCRVAFQPPRPAEHRPRRRGSALLAHGPVPAATRGPTCCRFHAWANRWSTRW